MIRWFLFLSFFFFNFNIAHITLDFLKPYRKFLQVTNTVKTNKSGDGCNGTGNVRHFFEMHSNHSGIKSTKFKYKLHERVETYRTPLTFHKSERMLSKNVFFCSLL